MFPAIDPKGELAKYADPMLLPSRSKIPMSLSVVLDLSRFLYHANPILRRAAKRVVAHGITSLSFRGNVGSPEERDNFSRFFREQLRGFSQIRLLGEEYFAYGTGFLRIYFPFVRTLIDRRGGGLSYHTPHSFPEEHVRFDLSSMTYEVPDPRRSDLPVHKRPKVKMTIRDTPGKDFTKIRIVRLDPRHVKLRYSTWSGEHQVLYSFEPRFKAKIRKGDLFEVNRTPVDVLKAIRDKHDYLFNTDAVFSLVNETITGISEHGWGLPETMANYPIIHKIAMYDRIDETIANEMSTPFRVISPNFSGLKDADATTLGSEFRRAAAKMHREQQADRTKLHGFPIPLNYQEMGGQGKALSPKELKDYEQNQLLNAMGFPVEMFTGNMAIANVPYAVRLFESTWAPLYEGLSGCVHWAVERISRYMNGEAFDVVLEPSSVADDAERRAMLANLFAGQEIPRRLLFKSFGVDDKPTSLRKERAQEDLTIQEELAGLEEETRRKAELGSLDNVIEMSNQQAGGGASQSVVTPTDLRSQAEQLAQEWLAIPTDGQRSQAMQAVRAQNPDLYASAKDIMGQMRAQGESQGRQMVNQQAQQPGGPEARQAAQPPG